MVNAWKTSGVLSWNRRRMELCRTTWLCGCYEKSHAALTTIFYPSFPLGKLITGGVPVALNVYAPRESRGLD